jgi:hypothetical protein
VSSLVRENGRSGGHAGGGDGFEVAALSWHVHLNGDRETLGMSAVNVPLTIAGGFCVVGDGRTSPLRLPTFGLWAAVVAADSEGKGTDGRTPAVVKLSLQCARKRQPSR